MNSLKRVSRRLKVRKSRQLEALEPRHLLATVGGVIAADTVWTRDDSPYEVISDVTVLENVTLEIEPGVTVLFDQNTGLNVNGRLVAEGSAFDRITFDRASGAPDWDGIVFVDTLADSRITFADMRYGDNQGEAINVNHSRLLLDNIVWEGTTGTILELEHPSVIVRNSHFPVSNGSEIIHGEYIENDEYLIIEGNIFDNSDNGGDVIDILGADRPGPVMQILHNVFMGGGDDGLDLDGTDAHVEGNLFMNFHVNTSRATTSNAIATGLPQTGEDNRTQITVVRNIFWNNDHGILLKEDAFGTIENNVFVGMKEAAIQFGEVGGTAVNGPGLGAELDGNIFWNNAELFKNLVDNAQFTTQLNVNRSLMPSDLIDFDGQMINPLSLGVGNIDADPLFVDAAAGDFRLQAGSLARGAGPDGLDMGAYVLAGPTVNEIATTGEGNVTFQVGGPGITNYVYRLNEGPYSRLTPVAEPIDLADLPSDTYRLEVLGMNDAGEWYTGQTPAFQDNSAQIIAPTRARSGETLPMVLRVLDWQGVTDTLYTHPLTLDNAGDLDNVDVRVKKGVGSLNPVVTASGDFSLALDGALAESVAHDVQVLDGTFPVQTYAGTLSGDTVWDATADRHITADLLIPSGSTLTIAAGTRILLDDQVNVEVEGEIVTNGTPDDPVVFNAFDRTLPWGGLELVDTTGTLQHTFFTNGGADDARAFGHSDSQPLIFVDGSTLSCDGCYVINNVGKAFGSRRDAIVNIDASVISEVDTGAQFDNSIVTVTGTWLKNIPNDDGVFDDDDNDGFYFLGVHSSGEPSRFQDSFILTTKDDGLDHNGARLEVVRAWIEGVAHEGVAASSDDWVTIDDSVFIGNNQGVEAGYQDPDVFVTNSVLFDNDNKSDPNSPITAGLRFGDGYDGSNGNYTGHITAANLVIDDNGDNVRNYDGTIPGPQVGAIDISFSLTNDVDYDNDLANFKGIPVFGPFMHLLRGSAGRSDGSDGLDVGRRLPAATYEFTITRTEPLLRISEVLAFNTASSGGGNTFPDLVELHNGGGTPIDLAGYMLSNDPANPSMFVFGPDSELAPGEYLTVVADTTADAGGIALGFSLSDAGDELLLSRPAAEGGALADSVTFGRQLSDRSLVRLPTGQWHLGTPTFGTENSALAVADAARTSLNEWLAAGNAAFPTDFIELYNTSGLPLDIGGVTLTNDINQPLSPLPPLSFVEPEGFAVFLADGNGAAGPDHLGFVLDASGGSITLLAADGAIIDNVTYAQQTAGISQGRRPNGGSLIDFFDPPNPGSDNPGDPGGPITDTTPPNAPGNLAALPISGSQLDLTWNASVDPESGVTFYRVFRDNVEIGTSTTTSFSDTSVVIGETYVYEVAAVNGADLESLRSLPAITTIPNVIAFQDGLLPSSSYTGTEDTWLNGSNPTTNYGGDARMDADGESGNSAEWTVMRWDLSGIEAGNQIASAVISLTVNNSSDNDYGIYALLTNWVEAQATWNQAANGQAWATPGTGASDRGALIGVLSTNNQVGTHDVVFNAAGINLVQSWVDAPATNFGVIIYNAAATDGIEIRSSNYGTISQRPKLSVGLASEDVTPPAVVSANALLGQAPQSFRFTFDEVMNIDAADVVLVNETTGSTVDGANLSFAFHAATRTASWQVTGLPGGVLPAGDYTATLQTASVTDLAGNPLAANGLEVLSFTRQTGDADGDQVVNAADIDLVCSSFTSSSNNGLVDLNGDGTVDMQDVDFLVQNVLGTQYGDADLRGTVDAGDFAIWNTHRFQSGLGWEFGDFNCDGNVDAADFNRWNDNRFVAPPAAKTAPAANGRVPRAPAADARIRHETGAYAAIADAVFAEDVNEITTRPALATIDVDNSATEPRDDPFPVRFARWVHPSFSRQRTVTGPNSGQAELEFVEEWWKK